MADDIHPLCCDCDECLNGSGGYTLPGAGLMREEPGYSVTRAGLESQRASQKRYLQRRKAKAVAA